MFGSLQAPCPSSRSPRGPWSTPADVLYHTISYHIILHYIILCCIYICVYIYIYIYIYHMLCIILSVARGARLRTNTIIFVREFRTWW